MKPTVLIAEDVKKFRDELKELLEDEFNVVALATNGLEAVELYRQHKPNLVVMDIVMPKLSGIEATTQILGEFPRARVVILSGLQDENIVLSALQAGAIDYLFKPVEGEKLKALLNEYSKDETRNKARVP